MHTHPHTCNVWLLPGGIHREPALPCLPAYPPTYLPNDEKVLGFRLAEVAVLRARSLEHLVEVRQLRTQPIDLSTKSTKNQ